MAIITNQANLTYTYGATTASVRSNVAATELAAALDAEKRALDGSYRAATTLTVPAATFAQDPETGAVTVSPGTLTVVVTGTV